MEFPHKVMEAVTGLQFGEGEFGRMNCFQPEMRVSHLVMETDRVKQENGLGDIKEVRWSFLFLLEREREARTSTGLTSGKVPVHKVFVLWSCGYGESTVIVPFRGAGTQQRDREAGCFCDGISGSCLGSLQNC